MQDSIEQYMQKVGQQAREASRVLTSASTSLKNHALSAIYTALENNQAAILAANQIDMDKGRSNQLNSALLDRLELTPARIKGMLQGLKDVLHLSILLGKLLILHIAPQAFKLEKCVYL